jgi:hypothetical protein
VVILAAPTLDLTGMEATLLSVAALAMIGGVIFLVAKIKDGAVREAFAGLGVAIIVAAILSLASGKALAVGDWIWNFLFGI